MDLFTRQEVDAGSAAIAEHFDCVCGIKIRLGASLADEGVNEAIACVQVQQYCS